MNVLGLVVFSVLMGVILSRMGTKGKPLMDFCTCLAEASMKIFVIFIWYVSPVFPLVWHCNEGNVHAQENL